jgi:hypothetical protein
MRNAGIYPTPHRARPPLSFGHAATLLLFDFGLFWLLLFCAALLEVHFRTGPLHTLARLVALAAFVEAIWSVVALIIGLTRSPAAPASRRPTSASPKSRQIMGWTRNASPATWPAIVRRSIYRSRRAMRWASEL